MAKIFIEGHGCSASLADTEIISGLASSEGYELVEDSGEADLSIIVTCSVKDVTEKRMLSRIEALSNGGRSKIIVAGCLPKADHGKIERIDPRASMIGPGNLDRVSQAIASTLRGERFVDLSQQKLVKVGLTRSRRNQIIGVVEISSGCLSSCTFCQVKLIKGTVFSYPEDQIVKEAKNMVDEGAREIWLTSTDNAAYGRDTRTTLPNLVKKVAAIPGDFKIRIGMMNPLLTDRILDELIVCYSNSKVFKFLHLPVQSGSDRILKLMQRGYSVADFYRTVSVFRDSVPGLTLSTDIIVGFPSESEDDYKQTVELVRTVKPDVVNLSRYGARSGTRASMMNEQISSGVSKERSQYLTEIIRLLAKEKNKSWIGWKGSVLVDERVRNAFVGRNFAYKPCLLKDEDIRGIPLGDDVDVEVVDATASTLHCKMV